MWSGNTVRFAIALAVGGAAALATASSSVACRFQARWAAAAHDGGMLRIVQAFDPQGGVLRADATSGDDRTCDPAVDQILTLTMIETLRAGGVLLLGEVHDNPLHHRMRGLLIEHVFGKLRPPLVFEQIRVDQQAALDRFADLGRRTGRPATARDLFGLLEWDKSGWPDQKIYEPLFSAAITAKLPILPGDPPKGKVREVARGGLDALPPEERVRMKLDVPLPPPLADALAVELKDSHCGMLPHSAIRGLSAAQGYRDAHLADALLKAAGQYGSAILITGNGHVRTDRGVPWHIRLLAPGRKVVSVMLIEIEGNESNPDRSVPRAPDGRPAADFILFTARAERSDPCAEMRKDYGKRG